MAAAAANGGPMGNGTSKDLSKVSITDLLSVQGKKTHKGECSLPDKRTNIHLLKKLNVLYFQ